MPSGKLLAIAIAPERKAAMRNAPEVEVVVGEGLAGDRYGAGLGAAQFQGRRKPENEVTLIAREAIAAANEESGLAIEHLHTRRNLLTEGVSLNDLVGRTFRVGPVGSKGWSCASRADTWRSRPIRGSRPPSKSAEACGAA